MRTSVFHHTGAIKKEILTPSEVNRQDAADWRRSSEWILLFFIKGQAGKGTFGKSPAHTGND